MAAGRTCRGLILFSALGLMSVGRVATTAAPPEYPDHHDLMCLIRPDGSRDDVRTTGEWQMRRRHIIENLERVMGPLPGKTSRLPLDVQSAESVLVEPPQVARSVIRTKLTFQSDANDRVPAWLLIPAEPAPAEDGGTARRPAVLCLQQTTEFGKDEPAGIHGDPDLKYALELAEQGFVTLAPDYPSFGEHGYDFEASRGYVSGSMKAIWDNIRAVDLLQSLAEVDPERIGCIGHSLGGHNAIFTAVFEPRLKVVVSSCGFTSLRKDDIPSWTGERYMPRIAAEFGSDPERVPFDFPELIGAIAPRPFLASAATEDSDFDVSGVRDVMQAAAAVYRLYEADSHLQAIYPTAPHSFPDAARRQAFEFLKRHLEREPAR